MELLSIAYLNCEGQKVNVIMRQPLWKAQVGVLNRRWKISSQPNLIGPRSGTRADSRATRASDGRLITRKSTCPMKAAQETWQKTTRVLTVIPVE